MKSSSLRTREDGRSELLAGEFSRLTLFVPLDRARLVISPFVSEWEGRERRTGFRFLTQTSWKVIVGSREGRGVDVKLGVVVDFGLRC